MDIDIKGLRIGRFIITTKKALKNSEIKIDSKEVWNLFLKALREDKIVFTKNKRGERIICLENQKRE